MIAYLEGASGADVLLLDRALEHKQAVLPPVVLTELLSDFSLPPEIAGLFKTLPTLELLDGFWERAGVIRASLLAKGHRARIADSLIAQSCLDHKIGLLTRDSDFKAFSKICELLLIH